MRRMLLSIVFGALVLPVVAREFYPMLKDGKEWNYYYTTTGSWESNYYFRLAGDTIIDGEKGYKVWFKHVHQQTGQVFADYTLQGAMIEKDGRTYYIEPDGRRRLICDLNMKVGEILTDVEKRVVDIDSIYVMGRTFRRLSLAPLTSKGLNEPPTDYWVEGIGCSAGFPEGQPTSLVTCYEDGHCIFANVEFTDMPAVKTEPAAIPLLEEGKVWWYYDAVWPNNVFRMFVEGDTIANGRTWKKLYHDNSDEAVPVFAKALREDGGRVYQLTENGSEKLVYDFTLGIGDRYTPESNDGRYMEVIAVDTMFTEGVAHRRLILQQYLGGVATDLTSWIEGIGSDYGIDLTAFWSTYDWKVQQKSKGDTYYYLFFECVTATGQHVYSSKWKSANDIQSVISIPSASAQPRTHQIYDLQGRQIQQPTRGIYIRGGRKVVVK